MKLFLTALMFMLMVAVSAVAAEREDASRAAAAAFTFAGEPIDPVIVGDFCGWVSDSGATLRTVDLTEATGSNRYASESVSGDAAAGFRIATLAGETGVGGKPFVGYRCVGRLTNGDFVVIAVTSGGGTGRFQDLLVLRRVVLPTVDLREPAGEHAGLTLVATMGLGDRDDGEVSIDGDVVTVGASRYRETTVRVDFGGGR